MLEITIPLHLLFTIFENGVSVLKFGEQDLDEKTDSKSDNSIGAPGIRVY